MPVATPEQYADMLDRAKAGGFAYPAINVSSSQTINAVLQGLPKPAPTASSRSPPAAPTTSPATPSRPRRRAPSPSPSSRTEVAKNYPITVALHTDHCPKDALDGLRAAAHRRLRGGGRGRAQPDLPVAHVGRLGGAAGREHRDRQGPPPPPQGDQRHPRGRDRRRRRRRGRRAARGIQRGALHDRRRRTRDGRGPRPRRARPLHLGAHLRQRARRVQAGQRQAAPELLSEIQDGIAREFGTGRQAPRPRLPRRRGSTDEEIAEPVATASSR